MLLSRWQFGVTITYHFLFVPLTIGLALLVAIMQVLAYRRKDAVWERLTRFFGTLFLINFAMGIVTGIVQEFQFGHRRNLNQPGTPDHRSVTTNPQVMVAAPSAVPGFRIKVSLAPIQADSLRPAHRSWSATPATRGHRQFQLPGNRG